MDLGLRGRVALVSGGSRGIGRAVVALLADEGVRVVIAARGADAVQTAVDEVRSAGGDAIGVAADMATADGVATAVAAARAGYGSPDIAVANVASANPVDLFTGRVEAFAEAFDSMTLSVIHLARAVVPDMRANQWGRLVNIGAGIAQEPPPQAKHAVAAMQRAAVATLGKSMSNELAADGITVNTIGTGFTSTQAMLDMAEGVARRSDSTAADVMRKFTAAAPAKRAGTPAEIAAIVVMLCSVQSAYLTGQFIPVDGGSLRSTF
ncbi:MAG: putative 3-oxoacyl-[acyl-carrier protein] reductase [Pseudonocardiales bacterium]|nr:putative 3-oxoacyl-[acyl-carrier protein] reductase [Pseudonocardiales bacterium]